MEGRASVVGRRTFLLQQEQGGKKAPKHKEPEEDEGLSFCLMCSVEQEPTDGSVICDEQDQVSLQ